MSERFERVFALPENLYTKGAPVLIAAGALLKDNQTGNILAQLKFKNITSKKIKALKVSVDAFDVSGKELEGVSEYQYLDLTARRDNEFGQKQAITLADNVTRSFRAKCTSVIFDDGEIWDAPESAEWKPTLKQDTLTGKLGTYAEQYKRDTLNMAKFVPAEVDDLWLCACGAINFENETKCHSCNSEKEKLFSALDKDTLKKNLDAYRKAESERMEREATEKAARMEKEAAEKAVKNAKIKKISIISGIAAALVIAAVVVYVSVIMPMIKYNAAVAMMDNGEYEEAIAAFEAMNGYRDSEEKLAEMNNQRISRMLENGVWFFNGGSDTVLKQISFTSEHATITQYKYDNGIRTIEQVDCSYTMDDNNITVKQDDGSELTIHYQINGDTVKLGDSGYFTAEEFEARLHGSWKLSYSSDTAKYEYNAVIKDGNVTWEYARCVNKSLYLYYNGPYKMYYKFDADGITYVASLDELSNKLFFNIIDQSPVLLYDGRVFGWSFDGLPGSDGYRHLWPEYLR